MTLEEEKRNREVAYDKYIAELDGANLLTMNLERNVGNLEEEIRVANNTKEKQTTQLKQLEKCILLKDKDHQTDISGKLLLSYICNFYVSNHFSTDLHM